MTPKQCAAKLLLNAIQGGAAHPARLDRMQMAEALGTRISDEKRAKILTYVTKIEGPYVERLVRLSGEGDGEDGEGQTAAGSAG
jgi:hypothetical protein